MAKKTSVAAKRIQNQLTLNGPMTTKQLMYQCFCHEVTVRTQLARLHRARVIHIKEWSQNRTIIWGIGDEPDAVRQPGMSDRQKYEQRKKRPAIERDVARNKRNARMRKLHVDPLTAAFFGG